MSDTVFSLHSLSWLSSGLRNQGDNPKGSAVLPDRRLPIGQKEILLCALSASVVNRESKLLANRQQRVGLTVFLYPGKTYDRSVSRHSP